MMYDVSVYHSIINPDPFEFQNESVEELLRSSFPEPQLQTGMCTQ